MNLKLLVAPKNYSSWSARPWLVMRHFGIPFEEVVAPLFIDDAAKQTIEDWSGAGKVPVLRDGDLTIWDSLAIIEYLAEVCPEHPVWPTDRAVRAKARAVSAEMHSSFMALRSEMPMNTRHFVPGFAYSDDCAADIERIQTLWRDMLALSGGPFLFGSFSAADAMYAPVISRFKTYDVPFCAMTQAYAGAVWALPAVKAWLDNAAAEPWTIAKYDL